MSKELEDLIKRVSELEKQVKSGSFNTFGRAYSSIGSSNSDFIIKTRGQVKIQWGNKFIDLIKDGKINVTSKFIFTGDSVGNNDGIYVVGDNNEQRVVLVSNGNQIDLKGEIGNTYVSFQGTQETTSQQKYTALQNIGFIYKDLNQIELDQEINGIVYVEETQKLYIIQNGNISEYTIDIANPYPNQFIIQKEDNNKGSIVILGNGINNSLAFDSLYLYTQSNNTYFDSTGDFYFKISDRNKIRITPSTAIFNIGVQSNSISSIGASDGGGFRIYTDENGSTLEIDNLIVRNSDISPPRIIYPVYWTYKNNIIQKASLDSDDNIILELSYLNEYQVGQKLYTYINKLDKDTNIYNTISLSLEVLNISEQKIITQILNDQSINNNDLESMTGSTVFLVYTSNSPINTLRITPQNLDIIQITNEEQALDTNGVISRVGDLSQLQRFNIQDGEQQQITGYGIYSNIAMFDNVLYTSSYNLPISDNSSKLVSTEWIHKLFPKGTILMFGGSVSDIPEGWAICDGTNGTPNLIGRFIKSETQSGQTGGANEVTLTIDNLPSHTHTVQSGSITTSTNGGHSHTYTQPVMGQSDNANDRNVVESTTSGTTSSAGEHSHTVDVSGITLSSVGNNVPIKIEPLYYSLVFIMKIV